MLPECRSQVEGTPISWQILILTTGDLRRLKMWSSVFYSTINNDGMYNMCCWVCGHTSSSSAWASAIGLNNSMWSNQGKASIFFIFRFTNRRPLKDPEEGKNIKLKLEIWFSIKPSPLALPNEFPHFKPIKNLYCIPLIYCIDFNLVKSKLLDL